MRAVADLQEDAPAQRVFVRAVAAGQHGSPIRDTYNSAGAKPRSAPYGRSPASAANPEAVARYLRPLSKQTARGGSAAAMLATYRPNTAFQAIVRSRSLICVGHRQCAALTQAARRMWPFPQQASTDYPARRSAKLDRGASGGVQARRCGDGLCARD